jgi:hypothetical protein
MYFPDQRECCVAQNVRAAVCSASVKSILLLLLEFDSRRPDYSYQSPRTGNYTNNYPKAA